MIQLGTLMLLTFGLPFGIWLTILGYEISGILLLISGWAAFIGLILSVKLLEIDGEIKALDKQIDVLEGIASDS